MTDMHPQESFSCTPNEIELTGHTPSRYTPSIHQEQRRRAAEAHFLVHHWSRVLKRRIPGWHCQFVLGRFVSASRSKGTMDASFSGQLFAQLPSWLQRTAERAQSQVQVPDHISVRRETCRVETQDGFKVLKCEEMMEVFRCAADG